MPDRIVVGVVGPGAFGGDECPEVGRQHEAGGFAHGFRFRIRSGNGVGRPAAESRCQHQQQGENPVCVWLVHGSVGLVVVRIRFRMRIRVRSSRRR